MAAPRSSRGLLFAGLMPLGRPGSRSRRAAGTQPSGCSRGRRRRRLAAWRVALRPPKRCGWASSPCPPTSPRPPSSSSPPARARQRDHSRGCRHEPPGPACSASSSGGAGDRGRAGGKRGSEPVGTIRVAAPPARNRGRRCESRWRSDELPLSALAPASPRARRRFATPPSCVARSPTASPPLRSAERARADGRTARDGIRVEGSGGLRGARSIPGDHRIAMLGAIAGVASREGVEVEGNGSPRSATPGFEVDCLAFGLTRAGGGCASPGIDTPRALLLG